MKITRQGWMALGVMAVLAAAIGIGWRVWRPDGPPLSECKGLLGRPLRVGVVSWPGYAGGIVANNGFKPNEDCIYYKQHNLCVEFVMMEDIDARAKAFAHGGREGVDIVWSTVDFWANELPGFLRSGVKAKAIMQVDWSRGGDAIVVDDSIQSVEDLYKKRIALALFTPSHWLLESSLQGSRLDEAKQTEIVRALVGKGASPDARADFVARRVDAAVVWEPDVSSALLHRPRSHVLLSTAQANKLIADVMVAREDFIRAHPDVIQAFIEGWVVDGTVQANRDPEAVVRLLMANEPLYRDLGPDVTKENLAKVKWAGPADNLEMFDLDNQDPSPMFDEIFTHAGKSWVARGYIPARVEPAAAKDDRFIRKICDSLHLERSPSALPATQPPAVASNAPVETKLVTVNFAVGSAALDDRARREVDDQIAFVAEAFSGAYLRVEGNTDNVGDIEANRALSKRRAEAVVRYLVTRHHLPERQFFASGNGPDKPIAGNDTAAGRAMNRRTDVALVKG